QGETLEAMSNIIAQLDQPVADQSRLVVRTAKVERGDLRAIATMIQQSMATPGWRTWRGPDPDGVTVQVDGARRLLMLIGKQPRVEQAMAYVEELKGAAGRADSVLEAVPL